MQFLLFRNYLPSEKGGPFIWKMLSPTHPGIHCAKFGWNWPSGSWEKDFKFRQSIFAISKLSPLGKGRYPSFVQTWILFTQGCFVPSLVEIGPVVLEKKIFKLCLCILLIRNYLPLENGGNLHLNKLESPSPRDALCQVWLKLV